MHEKGRPRDKYEMDQWNDGESDQDARLPQNNFVLDKGENKTTK